MATEEKKFLDRDGLEYYTSHFYTKTKSDELRNYDDYFEEITYTKSRRYDTDCYFTNVPLNDSEGNQIDLHVEANNGLTPTSYARKTFTTLTTNATLTKKQSDDTYQDTIVIGNGQILHEYTGEPITDDYYYYVGIKANRTITDYQVINTTAADMLNDGVKDAFMVFFRLVKDGEAVEQTIDVATARHPRQCLGVKANGDIVFLTCDGRTERSAGLTAAECSTLLIEKGCVNAWNLDGGGSSSTTIDGSKLNSSVDSNGTADRKLNYSLNARKEIKNLAVARAYSKIGEEKMNTIAQLLNYSNAQFMSVAPSDIGGKNLNNLTEKKVFAYGNNLTNSPSNSSGYFINIPHAEERFWGLYSTQLFVLRDTGRIYSRQLLNGEFTPWILANGTDKAFLYRQSAQTLSATGTYENLKLTLNSRNDTLFITPTNYVTGSTTEFYGFKINTQKTFVIKAMLQLKAATTGNRYLRLGRNGNEISPTVTRAAFTADTEGILSTESVVSYSSNDDVFSLQLYGASGDSIERVKLIVEGY